MSDNFDDYVIIEEKPSIWQQLKKQPITYYLVGVFIIVFLAIQGSNFIYGDDRLVNTLMKSTYHIAYQGQWYRFFTAIFTHATLSHIFFNCFAIIILGRPVELIFGKKKFLIIFLVSGLFGSLSSFIFSEAPAIGASGGVFGMFGVHLYLFLQNKEKYLSIFGKDMLQLLVINVVIGFLLPNIDYWGHFGGILGGFLATLSLGMYHTIKINKQFLGGFLLTTIIFLGSFLYFDQAYTNYVDQVDDVIDDINAAINNDDLAALEKGYEQFKDIKPLLPPISDANRLDDEIKSFIQELK